MSEPLLTPSHNLVGIDGQPLQPNPRAPQFSEESEWRDDIMARLGDLADIEMLYNDVLVAKYIREKVSESLISAAETQREDNWQGSVGLVLKVGPRAFVDDEKIAFHGETVKPGDWVIYRNSDGWDKDIQMVGEYVAVKCRFIQDAHIRGRVKYPGRLY